MKILIMLSLFILSHTLFAQNIEWALQITDPEFDLKHIPLSTNELKPLLPKTSWRCTVGEVQKKGESESREIHCDYSIEKTGTFTTYTVCSPSNPYDESKIVLFDQRKNLNFTLLLLCRHSESKKEVPANP